MNSGLRGRVVFSLEGVPHRYKASLFRPLSPVGDSKTCGSFVKTIISISIIYFLNKCAGAVGGDRGIDARES